MSAKLKLVCLKGFHGSPAIKYSLEIQVSDVAKLDEVRPQVVDLPVRLSVVLHLRPQVLLQVQLAVVDLSKSALQLFVIDQKATKGGRNQMSQIQLR